MTASELLQKLSEGQSLTASEAGFFFDSCLKGELGPSVIAACLMAMKLRGETVTEILAGAMSLRRHALGFEAQGTLIDTCGTGGDGTHSYNISTAVALVLAGCGLKVAKHGNRSVSSKSGSSEVLSALGVNIDATPEQSLNALNNAGVCFLFAPLYHPAMKNVAPIRKDLGLRTIFNLLGPLANPAKAQRQILGVYDRKWLRPMAETLGALGVEKAWVVHGFDGMDELSLTGPSFVAQYDRGVIQEFEMHPEDLGLRGYLSSDLAGGDPDHNAAALMGLLKGQKSAYRDMVALNAAAGLVVSEACQDLGQGLDMAHASIDSGAAKRALDQLIIHSNA